MATYWLQINYDPDIYEIKVPFTNIATTATNCYVVKDGDDALVVDTGAPTDRGFDILVNSLREIGVDPAEARYFCTHLHLDHAGLVNRIGGREPRVYASLADLNTMVGIHMGTFDEEFRDILYQEGLTLAEIAAFLNNNKVDTGPEFFDYRKCRMSYLQQGDCISVGRYGFQVVETPGHSRGHQCLYEPSSGILFGGDHILYIISPGIELYPDGADSIADYLGSLRRCRDLHAKQLLVAHGGNHAGFEERIDWLEAHHKERLDRAVELVGQHPGLRGMQISKRMPWSVHRKWNTLHIGQRWAIVSLAISVFTHLVLEGRLVRNLGDDARYYYEVPKRPLGNID